MTPNQFKTGLAELKARLTWRFAGAMLAQTGVILAAVLVLAAAIRHPAHARQADFHGPVQPWVCFEVRQGRRTRRTQPPAV